MDQSIRITSEKISCNPENEEVGAEYVIESTGLFLTKESTMAISHWCKTCCMSAPSKDDTPCCYGVNQDKIQGRRSLYRMHPAQPILAPVTKYSMIIRIVEVS